MNGKERILKILNHEPVDRIGLFEHFWDDTKAKWIEQGHLKPDETMEDHFDYDIQLYWPFVTIADLDFENEIIEQTEDTTLVKDGNGAYLRWHNKHQTTPEHVDFTVKNRSDWEQHIRPLLINFDERRIKTEGYRAAKKAADEAGRFFCIASANVFELMHPVCGHEYMLMGMALEPDWIIDMVEVYSDFLIRYQKRLFELAGKPDGIWYYEDMGFKEKPFMSPTMYKDLIQLGHIKTIAFAHELNLKVIMHSCGFIEPLLPGMIEAGIDCLQVIEVKAGMDLLKLYKQFGDVIAFMGGIDVRVLYSNDQKIIRQELDAKVPELLKKNAYILHSDHSIPSNVQYESYQYFIKEAMKYGTDLDERVQEG